MESLACAQSSQSPQPPEVLKDLMRMMRQRGFAEGDSAERFTRVFLTLGPPESGRDDSRWQRLLEIGQTCYRVCFHITGQRASRDLGLVTGPLQT